MAGNQPVVGPGDLPLWEDVRDFSEWMVALRRAVPPNKWVEELAAEAELNSLMRTM